MATGDRPIRTITPAHIADHYNDFSWVYQRYWGDHIHHGFFQQGGETPAQAQELLLRYCAARAGVRPGMAVVDVGCGYGGTVRFLAHQCSCSVLGLSISEVQIRLAKKSTSSSNGQGSVRFELADAEKYEFPAAHFDVVWNMESSEHFFDKAAYFRKAAATLKPGGALMLAAWTGSMEEPLIRDIAQIYLCPDLLTTEEYTALIEAAGLRIGSSEKLGPEVARTWEIGAEQARAASSLLAILPEKFHRFTNGIELMRKGYATGQLSYSIIVGRSE